MKSSRFSVSYFTALAFFVSAQVVPAATFNVANGDVAALKAAMVTANSNGESDTINLAAGGSYTLTIVDNLVNGSNGLPVINNDVPGLDLTINGNGATIQRSTLAGTPEFRIVQVGNSASVNVTGLTIANGKVSGSSFPGYAGAGIYNNQATLGLSNCVIRQNDGRVGGGLFNHGGNVALSGGSITANSADTGAGVFNNVGTVTGTDSVWNENVTRGGGTNVPGSGGAIYNFGTNGTASLMLTGCSFTSNRALSTGSTGAGVYNDSYLGNATATFTNCSFTDNIANLAGAIGNDFGMVTMTACSFTSNSARTGGAAYNFEGSLEVRLCTFSQNSATGSGGSSRGGAIWNVVGTLTLADSILEANSAEAAGGALYNIGTATITNSDLYDNTSPGVGAGISNEGVVTLLDSMVTNNTADSFGGGIYNDKTLVVQRSTVNGNISRFSAGGGIFNSDRLTVQSSTFTGNKAVGSYGGAITTFGSAGEGTATIESSTFSSNQSARGGGVSNFGGTLTLVNSTLSANSAAEGGGLHNLGGNASVQSNTFLGNAAPSGGGIYNVNSAGPPGTVNMRNTILASTSGGNISGNGIFTSEGHNLSNDAAGGGGGTGPGGLLNGPGDIRNTNPNLGPLQNNGGPTQTHALLTGSPATDAGDDAVLAAPFSLTNDQRGPGFPRRKGPHVDIGAFESGVIFVVTTVDDHNDGACTEADCTLREAISAANALSSATISFAPGVSGAIQLAAPLPTVSSNMLLQGPGQNALTVRRNSGGDYRIFTISNGTATGPLANITGLTISNGQAAAGAFPSSSGGGILNDRGKLTVGNCMISGNRSFSGDFTYGGGIFNHEGSLTVTDSTLAANTGYYGGGFASSRTTAGIAMVSVSRSTISGNNADGGYGGGIYSQAQNGGGIAQVAFTNCTLSGNSANGGFGGGIYTSGANSGNGAVTLLNCTLIGNNAPSGGGIYNFRFNASALVTLRNTILKTGDLGANLVNDGGGQMTSGGHNLSSDSGGGFLIGSGDQIDTDPELVALAHNGGPTQTHALSSTSPAINAGDDNFAPVADQRWYSRNGISDIGAFEFNGTPPPAVSLASVVSRKVHGSAGSYDINLPLAGSPGIECRTGGASGNHALVFVFANTLASVGGAGVTSGTGGVASSGIGADAHEYVVNLTGVANAQEITVTLTNVTDSLGNSSAGVTRSMGVLLGDTTASRVVNASDIGQTKAQSGQPVTASNFRTDVNVNGSINASDISFVKSKSGTQLP